jgi:DNA-binding NtrC family response regulator
MANQPTGTTKEYFERLRRAIRRSGLIADLSVMVPDEQAIAVTNKLAQTTVRYLTNNVDAKVGQRLAEELRSLAGPGEYDLLMEETGFTFFHVVQFQYEFARFYAADSQSEDFCAGMGKGGGGVEVAPHTEVISLIRLLTTALSPDRDSQNVGILIKTLGPLFLSQIFTAGLFNIDISEDGETRLIITLKYADRKTVEVRMKELGLQRDVGRFFVNTALHIQGLLQRSWDVFALESKRAFEMGGVIEKRSDEKRLELAESCTCIWTVEWRQDVALNRLVGDNKIYARAQTIFDALNQKELDYYLERIKTLELQVKALGESGDHHGLVGDSAEMQEVYRMIDQVATTDLTVLIRGESGSGKELVARAIHDCSGRKDHAFVAVNCAAFPETLLESELFGYEKGAFTGADRDKPGRFELADGGTLFLDEVGDIPLSTQVKLLRVLENQAFERVGGTDVIQTDVRILGATNRNLEELIESSEFREDFYFRLNVLPMTLPPLRAHKEDIPQLAQHFLERSALRSGKTFRGFSRGAIQRLVEHSWPGNVRVLQNVIERAVVVYARGETITEADIRQALGLRETPETSSGLNARQQKVIEAIGDFEGSSVEDLLEEVQPVGRGSGRSKRTLQNDLRMLADTGYIQWHKEGSARCYALTSKGRETL